jgi:hypothetical protein
MSKIIKSNSDKPENVTRKSLDTVLEISNIFRDFNKNHAQSAEERLILAISFREYFDVYINFLSGTDELCKEYEDSKEVMIEKLYGIPYEFALELKQQIKDSKND